MPLKSDTDNNAHVMSTSWDLPVCLFIYPPIVLSDSMENWPALRGSTALSRGAADSTAIRREPQFRCNIKQRFRLHASLSRLSFLSLRLWLFHHAAPPVFFFFCMTISCFFFSFLRFFSICLGLYFVLFPRFSSFLSSVCVSTSFLLQFLLSPTLRKAFFFFVSLYLSLSTSYLSSLLCISYFFYSVTNLSPHLSTCVDVCFLVCLRACSSNPRFICLWPFPSKPRGREHARARLTTHFHGFCSHRELNQIPLLK